MSRSNHTSTGRSRGQGEIDSIMTDIRRVDTEIAAKQNGLRDARCDKNAAAAEGRTNDYDTLTEEVDDLRTEIATLQNQKRELNYSLSRASRSQTVSDNQTARRQAALIDQGSRR